MADELTATLAAIRERAEAAANYTTGDWAEISARDVPPLLAAVEAVLERHQPKVRRQGWPPTCSYDNRRWPCPEVEAITAALAGTGKEGSEDE